MKATEFSRPAATRRQASIKEFQAPIPADTALHRVQAHLGVVDASKVSPASSSPPTLQPIAAVEGQARQQDESPYGLDSDQNAEWVRIRDGGDPELRNAIINWN